MNINKETRTVRHKAITAIKFPNVVAMEMKIPADWIIASSMTNLSFLYFFIALYVTDCSSDRL